jgi:CubicO group peptidase (beta-lactamase class C family)
VINGVQSVTSGTDTFGHDVDESGNPIELMPVQVTLSNWLEPPFNRVAFQHVRELVPTAPIRNSGGTVNRLRYALQPLDDVVFTIADGSSKRWGDHLADTYCDAVVVVHGGKIVFERYFDGMTDDTLHLLMSVSKSFCGALLGISIGRGLIDPDALVCNVAPEFAGTSIEGATVQQLIDMTAGTDFVEDYGLYDDPAGDAPLIEYERHAGYRPLGDRQPIGTLGQFATLGTAFEHGSRFDYRSPLTNVAARVIEIVNDERYPDVVSRHLWDALGQEHDADIMLDPLGHPVVEGGMSCSARDLARSGSPTSTTARVAIVT